MTKENVREDPAQAKVYPQDKSTITEAGDVEPEGRYHGYSPEQVKKMEESRATPEQMASGEDPNAPVPKEGEQELDNAVKKHEDEVRRAVNVDPNLNPDLDRDDKKKKKEEDSRVDKHK
jgi:hypothetical protein